MARTRGDQSRGPEPETPLGPDAWGAYLSAQLGTRVEVLFTRARRTVLKVEPRGGERLVRMNAFFSAAPLEVREAVAAWIRSGRRARRKLELLDAWVETQIEALERVEPKRVRVVTRGRVHDLERIAGGLRAAEFADSFADAGEVPGDAALPAWPRLTWGRAPRSRTRRTLRLGSFDFWTGVVRMHPVLDQPAVPESFVRYVLFHELLHAALPAERGHTGRRVFHGREFRLRERGYAGTIAALAWEKQHLAELLWSARTGKDMRPASSVGRAIAALELERAPAVEDLPNEVADPVRAAPSEGPLRRLVQRWLFP